MDIIALIQNVGFPIASVVALGSYINRTNKEVRDDFKSRERELLEANKQFAVALSRAADSITESNKTQGLLCERMRTIEDKVDDVKAKVEKLSEDE